MLNKPTSVVYLFYVNDYNINAELIARNGNIKSYNWVITSSLKLHFDLRRRNRCFFSLLGQEQILKWAIGARSVCQLDVWNKSTRLWIESYEDYDDR
jgi:hypothetical protein